MSPERLEGLGPVGSWQTSQVCSEEDMWRWAGVRGQGSGFGGQGAEVEEVLTLNDEGVKVI